MIGPLACGEPCQFLPPVSLLMGPSGERERLPGHSQVSLVLVGAAPPAALCLVGCLMTLSLVSTHVSRHCQMSPWGQNHRRVSTPGLGDSVGIPPPTHAHTQLCGIVISTKVLRCHTHLSTQTEWGGRGGHSQKLGCHPDLCHLTH